ncbi:MAG: hypothetical protein KBG82_01430 [Spirochaetes bacterium]|jgi:hypothetical protein|nr:hypothetical protein [Caldisericia bacterium]MBP8990621.1 hypothetical protein [Spirochaetota bacterium]NLJ05933.1 hypothetical protein [Exilispira sp.]HNV43912.1 hypothetical protein [Exilispira sp.]HOV46958.1 hypothetical protein [Exilispira sp.]
MAQDAEKFLEAEETAIKLVENLKELHFEANSYKNAKMELDEARQKLINLIESTGKVTESSYEIIKMLKDIGGPEILTRINNMNEVIADATRSLNNDINNYKIDTSEKIDLLEKKMDEIDAKNNIMMQKMTKLILITLISSIAGIVIGVLNFFI